MLHTQRVEKLLPPPPPYPASAKKRMAATVAAVPVEAGAVLLRSAFSTKPIFNFQTGPSSFPASAFGRPPNLLGHSGPFIFASSPRSSHSVRTTLEQSTESHSSSPSPSSSSISRDLLPRVDKTGKLCSPRAARELALLVAYAACLEGSDPVRLFEKRLNARREPGYEFDKTSLLTYNHMSFGGPPLVTDTDEEAEELLHGYEKESAIEAEVLSAPPKLVYSKLNLRFTRKLLVALVDKWNDHVLVIDKVVPSDWKNAPAGRIMELCILHMAMSEITELETRHPIVINEAVDLAKRFCDGAAPRIINGCLRTFVKGLEGYNQGRVLEIRRKVPT